MYQMRIPMSKKTNSTNFIQWPKKDKFICIGKMSFISKLKKRHAKKYMIAQ